MGVMCKGLTVSCLMLLYGGVCLQSQLEHTGFSSEASQVVAVHTGCCLSCNMVLCVGAVQRPEGSRP